MKKLLILSALFLLNSCFAPGNDEIKQKTVAANYCQSDSECVHIGSRCGISCNIFVNKKEEESIRELIKGWDAKGCSMHCTQVSEDSVPRCFEGKCYFGSKK